MLSLDIKADIDELRRRLAIREECLKVMRISGMLLQKGVAADLTMYEIGSLICRQNIDTPSQLEVLCAQAATLARSIRDKVRRGESGVSSRSGWKRRTGFQRDERRGSVLSVIHSQPPHPPLLRRVRAAVTTRTVRLSQLTACTRQLSRSLSHRRCQ